MRRPAPAWASFGSGVVLAVLLVACGSVAPTPRPSAPELDIARIRAAFEGLDDLDSYGWTFTGTPSVVVGDVSGTVVNGDPFGLRYEITVRNAQVGAAIYIGDQAWQSVQGSDFQLDPSLILGVTDPMPFEPTFLDPLVDATGVEVIEGENVEGRTATRLRIFIDPADQAFDGILNVWIDDAEGFILRAEAAGTTKPASAPRRASPVALGATVTVERVNDPSNAVDPPA